jgi:hypothetical protein
MHVIINQYFAPLRLCVEQKFNELLILILTIVISIILVECKPGATADNANKAKISFTETMHDFGDISFNGDGKCRFEFKNTSKIPLIIYRVRTSCGCANPDWPEVPIPPGEKDIISVEYNTRIPGTFRKSITVYFNAKNSPVTLYIKGNVIKENQPE